MINDVHKSFLTCILVVSFLILSCNSRKNQKELEVKIGYLPITADVSFFVAIEKAFFEKENIKIKPIKFTSSNQAMDALLSGRISGAIMIGYSTLFTIFSKSPESFKIIQSGVETKDKFTSRIIVPLDSDIMNIKDLKGKSIGTYSGLTQRLNLLLILSNFFEEPEKVIKIIQVESNLQIPSFYARRFDALFTIDPFATIAIHKKIGKSIVDSPRAKYIVNPFPTCATVLSTDFINTNPELAKKIKRILDTATNWAEINHEEASLIISSEKYTNIPNEIALKCGTYEWWMIGEENIYAVQKLEDIMFEHKILDKKIDVKKMFAEF